MKKISIILTLIIIILFTFILLTNNKNKTMVIEYEANIISDNTNNIILVNKDNPIRHNVFEEENIIAKNELINLINDAKKNNLNISNSYSGYRSFNQQKNLYQNYINTYGEEKANLFSAKPNYSEHQTGLAFDLLDNSGNLIETSNEIKLVEENCMNYGFIIRYPEGKEHAEKIMEEKITLEEYMLKK